jgi:hypothetical protein
MSSHFSFHSNLRAALPICSIASAILRAIGPLSSRTRDGLGF